jgi:preprotein translocase subunit SecD
MEVPKIAAPTWLQSILGANAKVRSIVIGLVASYLVIRFPVILTGLPPDIKQAIFTLANEFLHFGIYIGMWFLKQSNVTGAGTGQIPHIVTSSDSSTVTKITT